MARHHRRHRRTHHRHNPHMMRINRHHRRRHIRRHFRHNPPLIAGLDTKDLLTAGGAVIAEPFIEKQLMSMLPGSITGTSYGPWVVKLGSAFATWYAAKALLGRRASEVVAIALGASIVAQLAQQFLPSLTLAGYTLGNGMGKGGAAGYFGPGASSLGLVTPGMFSPTRFPTLGAIPSGGGGAGTRFGPASWAADPGPFSPPF